MNYKIILNTDKGTSTYHIRADTAKHAVSSLIHEGKTLTFKLPIYGKVYPEKGIKILEFVILLDKKSRMKVSYIKSTATPLKFDWAYKIEHEKFLEDVEKNNRYYILLTGIDLKYHGTYKTFVIMKDEGKRLHDSGKRVSIAVLKDNITFTYTSLGVIINKTSLEEYVKTHTTATLIKFKPIKE